MQTANISFLKIIDLCDETDEINSIISYDINNNLNSVHFKVELKHCF